jgi:hypothetical protein
MLSNILTMSLGIVNGQQWRGVRGVLVGMLQRSWGSGFAAGDGLRKGLKFGDNFLAITSSACAILDSSARSLSTPTSVMIFDSSEH